MARERADSTGRMDGRQVKIIVITLSIIKSKKKGQNLMHELTYEQLNILPNKYIYNGIIQMES